MMLLPLALMATVAVSMHIGLNSRFARELSEDILGDVFAGRFEITELRFGVDPRHVEVYGVTLRVDDGREVAYYDRLEADLKLLPLLQRRILVDRAELYGARTLLEWDDRGGFTYTDLFDTGPRRKKTPEEERAPASFAFEARNVRVHDCDATLRWPDFKIVMEDAGVENFSMVAAGKTTMVGRGVTTPGGYVEFKSRMFFGDDPTRTDLKVAMKSVRVETWDWFDGGFELDRMSWKAEGVDFDITDGLMDFRPEDGFAYRGVLRTRLPAGFGPVEYFSGPLLDSPVDFTVATEGFFGRELRDNSYIYATSDIQMDVLDLKVANLSFDRGAVTAQLVNRRVYFTDVDIVGYGGRIQLPQDARGDLPEWAQASREPPVVPGRAWLSLFDQDFNLPLQIEGLDTAKVLEDVAPDLEPTATIPATGTLSGRVDVHGRLVDTEDDARGRSLPRFFEVALRPLELERPAETVAKAEAVVPTRKIALWGTVRVQGEKLTGVGDLEIGLDGDDLTVANLDLNFIDPALPLHAEVEARVGSLEPYLRKFGMVGWGGAATLAFTADGPLLNPTVEAGTLVVRNPKLPFYAGATRLDARFGLDDGWLNLDRATVDGTFGRLQTRGRVKLHEGSFTLPSRTIPLDLRFDASPLDLGVVGALPFVDQELGGTVHITEGRLKGPARQPSFAGRIASDGHLNLLGQKVERLQGYVDLDRKGLTVEGLDVGLGGGGVVRADVGWEFDGQVNATVDVVEVDFSRIKPVREAGVGGKLRRLRLVAAGQLDPKRIVATEQPVSGGPPEVSGADIMRWITTEPLDLKGSVGLTDLRRHQTDLGSLIAVWYTLDKNFLLTAIALPYVPRPARRLLYEPIAALSDGNEQRRRLLVREVHPASVGLDVVIPQDAADPVITATAHFDHFDARGIVQNFLSGNLAAERAASNVALDVHNTSLDRLRAIASLRGDRGPSVRLRPKRRETGLEQLFGAWSELLIGGQVELYLDRDTMDYSVELGLDELKVAAAVPECDAETKPECARGRALRNVKPVTASLSGDLLIIESLTLGAEGQSVEVAGTVELGDTTWIGVGIEGALNMALLNLLPSVATDVRGVAAVKLDLDGYVDELRPSGHIDFPKGGRDQVRFRPRGLNETVAIEGGTIAICGAGAEDDPARCAGVQGLSIVVPESQPLIINALDGRVLVTADLDYRDYDVGALEVRASTARALNWSEPGSYDLSFHIPEVKATFGSLSDPATWLIDGEVRVVEGRLYKDVSFAAERTFNTFMTTIGSGRTDVYEAPLLDRVPALRKIRFDLDITGRDFRVKNTVETATLDLELKADLRLQNTIDSLAMEGELLIVEGGKLTYKGGDFTIRKGAVSWSGPPQNPDLNVVAEAEVVNACADLREGPESDIDAGSSEDFSSYSIVLSVEGSARNFTPELSSTPFADDGDIASLLLLGCTRDKLSASSATSPTLGLALRPLLSRVESELNRYIELEEIRLETDLDVTRVRLSDRVSDRLVLRLSGAFGTDSAEQSGTLEIRILDSLSLEIGEETDSENNAKVEGNLRWRLFFKEH